MPDYKRITVQIEDKHDQFLELLAIAKKSGKSAVLRALLDEAKVHNKDFINNNIQQINLEMSEN